MKKFSILLVILAMFSALILVSCSGEETPEPDENGGGTTVEKVTITFNTDGGDPLESLSIEKGKDATLPTPTRAGYSFDGWYLGNTPWDGKSVSVNTTITAKWTLLEFEIEYIVENGENSGLNVPIYTVNDTFVFGVPTVIVEYYEFFGWYIVSENEKTPIDKISAGTTGKLTLYAEIKYQPFELALKDDNTYEVVGLRDPDMTEGEIPAYYKGKAVTSIKEQAFYENTRIEKIAFADTIKTIGYDAFSGCTSLKSVRMSSGIEDIDTGAFYDCPALEYNVYENISYLGNENNPYIALMMSNDMTATACVINENTRLISSQAFAVNALTSVTIPQSVISMGKEVFLDCSLLTEVVIEEGLTSIPDGAFKNCALLESVSLPSTLESIGAEAFSNCKSLKSAKIPDSVKKLGNEAFYTCSSLTSLTIGKGLSALPNTVFANCASLTSVRIPANIKTIGEFAFSACGKLKSVTIESGVQEVLKYAFYDCQSIVSIAFPETVTVLGESVFYYCYKLESVSLTGVKSIEKGTFYYCEKLTDVTLGNELEAIGPEAFCRSGLLAINIPDSVKFIGYGAFEYCRSMRTVKLGKGVEFIGDFAFSDSGVISIVLPESLVQTGKYLFSSSDVENIYIEAEEIPETWDANWCGTIEGTVTTGYGKNN